MGRRRSRGGRREAGVAGGLRLRRRRFLAIAAVIATRKYPRCSKGPPDMTGCLCHNRAGAIPPALLHAHCQWFDSPTTSTHPPTHQPDPHDPDLTQTPALRRPWLASLLSGSERDHNHSSLHTRPSLHPSYCLLSLLLMGAGWLAATAPPSYLPTYLDGGVGSEEEAGRVGGQHAHGGRQPALLAPVLVGPHRLCRASPARASGVGSAGHGHDQRRRGGPPQAGSAALWWRGGPAKKAASAAARCSVCQSTHLHGRDVAACHQLHHLHPPTVTRQTAHVSASRRHRQRRCCLLRPACQLAWEREALHGWIDGRTPPTCATRIVLRPSQRGTASMLTRKQ